MVILAFLLGDTLNPGLTLVNLRRIYTKTICLFWDRKTFETDQDENLGQKTSGLASSHVLECNYDIVSLDKNILLSFGN